MNSDNNQDEHVVLPGSDAASALVCLKCRAAIRLGRAIFDASKDRNVHIFECDGCGHLTWID